MDNIRKKEAYIKNLRIKDNKVYVKNWKDTWLTPKPSQKPNLNTILHPEAKLQLQ